MAFLGSSRNRELNYLPIGPAFPTRGLLNQRLSQKGAHKYGLPVAFSINFQVLLLGPPSESFRLCLEVSWGRSSVAQIK